MTRFYSLLACILFATAVSAQTQPNFILIIADDLNDYVAGFNGSPQVQTPNIKKIEKKGTTFVNAFTVSPKCAPSRTSMITGKDCTYTQIFNNHDIGCKNFRKNFKEELGNEEIFTIPEMLKDSGGYFTYNINKVMQCHPGKPDFDTTIADQCLKGLSWSKYIAFGTYGGAGEGGGDNDVILDYGDANDDGVNGFRFTPIPDSMESEMMDYISTDSAIYFLNDYAANPENYCNSPFFLSIGYKRPHGPFYVPEKYFLPYYNVDWDDVPYNLPYNDPVGAYPYNGLVMPPQPDPMWSDYFELPSDGVAHALNDEDNVHDDFIEFGEVKMAEIPPPVLDPGMTDEERLFALQESERANGILGYLASIRYLDAQIGRLYNTLKSHPELFSNTVIIITSDHGYSLGEKTHWRKGLLWETDLRIPLVIADLRTPVKKTCKRTVTNIDLMPTILELAGVENPTFADGSQYVDGYSLVPLLATPGMAWDRPVLSSVRAVELIEGHCFPQYSVRDADWHYIRYQTNGATAPDCNEALSEYQEELYKIGINRTIDPYEWNNLAYDSAYTATKAHLATFLPGGINYLQFDRTVDSDVELDTDHFIGVYPNPASVNVYFNIQLPSNNEAHLYIYDIMGVLISDIRFEGDDEGFSRITMPVSELPVGYYTARVTQGDFMETANFIVAR